MNNACLAIVLTKAETMNYSLNTIHYPRTMNHHSLNTIHYSPLTLWSIVLTKICKTNPIFPKIGQTYTLVIQGVMKTNPHFWPKNPKANFQNGKMNVNSFNTMNYEQKAMNYENKNKPNSKPKQTQNKPNQTQFYPPMAGKIAPSLRMSFILMGPDVK